MKDQMNINEEHTHFYVFFLHTKDKWSESSIYYSAFFL